MIVCTLIGDATRPSERVQFRSAIPILTIILFGSAFPRQTFAALVSHGRLRTINELVDVHRGIPGAGEHLWPMRMPRNISHNIFVTFNALFDFASQCVVNYEGSKYL